jgi:hypothetical protein
MSKTDLCVHLRQVLVFSLPLLRVFDAKAIGEDFTNSFKWHALALRIKEDNKQPAEEAYTAIEAKGTARCHALHHAEKG